MISAQQKLSKGLIIYSVLISDFEKLDFKSDALAGVRANFFNSNHNPQSDKTDMLSDNRSYSLSYTMRYGEPLLWKVISNNQQYQKVKRNSDEVYCVLTYGENGIVCKRLYFDNFHNWLATEYYDNELENKLLAVVKPVTVKGILCVKLDKILDNGEKSTEYLYPSAETPNKRCTGLVYSNCGMIWYDKSFKPADITDSESGEDRGKGFDFTAEDFTKPAVNPLDLFNAEYLTDKDFEQVEVEEEQPEQSGEYSAYDKIESILYEAHKTNKNIFGVVVSQSGETAAETAEPEETPEEAQTPEPAEKPETPAKSPGYEVKEAQQPETEIETKNGTYSYYGSLDEKGKRTGAGRTVSPEGLTVYEGSYAGDKRDGFGISYYKDGLPNYVGAWENGNRNGCGVGYRHSDGTMHLGKWLENTPNGVGARFGKDGEFLDVCSYSEGIREGKAVSFDEDGNVVIVVYKDGEPVAAKIVTDDDIVPEAENIAQ